MDLMTRMFGTVHALRGWAVANLVANCGIVVTGSVVRVTGSGLGCPEWPRCTPDSYVTLPANGLHGAIEFGNRTLTFVLIVVAVGTLVAAWRTRPHGGYVPRVRTLSTTVIVGILIQAVVGGLSVWYTLNPYVVAVHLLLSAALVSVCTWIVWLAYGNLAPATDLGSVALTRVTYLLTWISLYLGTLVTGSGPHAGDRSSPRTGLDVETVARVHAASVWLLLLVAIAALVRLRTRWAVAFVAVLVGQGAVGYVQYFAGLPRGLIVLHLLGACLAMVAATLLVLSVRRATEAAGPEAASGRRPHSDSLAA